MGTINVVFFHRFAPLVHQNGWRHFFVDELAMRGESADAAIAARDIENHFSVLVSMRTDERRKEFHLRVCLFLQTRGGLNDTRVQSVHTPISGRNAPRRRPREECQGDSKGFFRSVHFRFCNHPYHGAMFFRGDGRRYFRTSIRGLVSLHPESPSFLAPLTLREKYTRLSTSSLR